MIVDVEFFGGSEILQSCREAIRLANMLNCTVRFKFNGVTCLASVGGSPELLADRQREAMGGKDRIKVVGSRPNA